MSRTFQNAIALSPFPSNGSGAVPKIRGWFCVAIGATVGGGFGGPPPGAWRTFGAGADKEEAGGGAAPLGFLVDGGGAADLVVEDIEEVCAGLEELLDVWVLGGGGMGVGCFPLDTGGVGT